MKILKRLLGFTVSLLASLRLFLRWPMFMVGVATIPVANFVTSKVNLPPILSRVMWAGVFFGLMAASWYVAELIVILAAIAIVNEYKLLKNAYQKRRSQDVVFYAV